MRSSYLPPVALDAPINGMSLVEVVNRLAMRGFITYDHPEALGLAQAMPDRLFSERKLKPLENVREGFEKLSEAFIDLMSGRTTGKTLVLI